MEFEYILIKSITRNSLLGKIKEVANILSYQLFDIDIETLQNREIEIKINPRNYKSLIDVKIPITHLNKKDFEKKYSKKEISKYNEYHLLVNKMIIFGKKNGLRIKIFK